MAYHSITFRLFKWRFSLSVVRVVPWSVTKDDLRRASDVADYMRKIQGASTRFTEKFAQFFE